MNPTQKMSSANSEGKSDLQLEITAGRKNMISSLVNSLVKFKSLVSPGILDGASYAALAPVVLWQL